MLIAVLKFQDRFAPADLTLDLLERVGPVVGMDEVEERSTHQFLEAPAQCARERGTQASEIALRVRNAEHVQ